MKNNLLIKNNFLIAAISSTILLSVGCTNKDAEKKVETAPAPTAATQPGTPQVKDLLMQEIKPGTGKEIKDGMTAVVQYRGTFLDGKEFDSSYSRHQPFKFKLGAKEVIDGWEIGMKGMKVGAKRVLLVPPQMAYGEKGNGPVPPNTALKFEIELVDIKK